MKRWFDTLLARLMLVQLLAAALSALLIFTLTGRYQGEALARQEAVRWATALSDAKGLLPGPPPPDARGMPLMWRWRALPDEMRSLGIPVERLWVSGDQVEAIVWAELKRNGGRPEWLGLRSSLGGLELTARTALWTLGSVAFVAAVLWRLSRWIARPVADLRGAMRRFQVEGALPVPAGAGAPAELRELAQQFVDLARHRSEVDGQRRTMLAGISHDLRSPLGRIRLAAHLLPDTPEAGQRRDVIVRNVQLADRLLGSFIDYARAEDEPLLQRVDLTALVQDIAEGDPELQIDDLPDRPRWLAAASAVALERALRNLLDNARHHGAAPICLALRTNEAMSVLSVRDHGPGIPATDWQAMTQPFYRGDRSRHTPGTGLGLAIVQRTAVRHGGRLVFGDAGPGLRVELQLPPCEAQSAPT